MDIPYFQAKKYFFKAFVISFQLACNKLAKPTFELSEQVKLSLYSLSNNFFFFKKVPQKV